MLGRCDDEVSQGADPRHADVASTKHLGLVVLAFGMLQYVAAFAIWRGASLGPVVWYHLRERERGLPDALNPRVSDPAITILTLDIVAV